LSNNLILVTTRSFSSGKRDLIKELEQAGYQVAIGDFSHQLGEIKDLLPNAVAWIAGVAPITAEHLAKAPNLKIIARYGVGIESVNLTAAAEKNIMVTNTPGANSMAVAEHALALLFASARKVVTSFENVIEGSWQPVRGAQIYQSKIGVIGFGKIGRIVTQKLQALGAEVFVSDPFVDAKQIAEFGASASELDLIAKTCDFVILQAPGGQQIVDKKWIDQAKVGQIIINTARADLVDEIQVAAGLSSGRLGFYAADALVDEKNSVLLDPAMRKQILITAHVAAQTDAAIDQMGEMAVANVLAVLSNKPAINPV